MKVVHTFTFSCYNRHNIKASYDIFVPCAVCPRIRNEAQNLNNSTIAEKALFQTGAKIRRTFCTSENPGQIKSAFCAFEKNHKWKCARHGYVVQWGWRQKLAAGKEPEVMKQGITVQERLKDLRTEQHLKLEELAAVTGISKSALGSYENDEFKEISHKNLVELAKFYGVSTDYLLCLTKNRSHPGEEDKSFPNISQWKKILH